MPPPTKQPAETRVGMPLLNAAAAHVKLRSPSLPLLHPRDPLALIVELAERCPDRRPAAAWPTGIVWSAAEGVLVSADIYLEKTLFDAFRPLNATVNAVRALCGVCRRPHRPLMGAVATRYAQVLAAVTAVSAEAIAKGVLNVPEEDEDESQREPMDWGAVAQGTGINFARESTALTLQRATERLAKPRVSPHCRAAAPHTRESRPFLASSPRPR